MRRVGFVFAVVALSALGFALPAGATGPGGWDHIAVGSTPALPSLNGAVYAVNTDNPPDMYVGGNFTSAGGVAKAKRLARWNGFSWSAVASTPLSNGAVHAIAFDDATGRVFAGGTFLDAGGNTDADFLAVWNGSIWSPFCTGGTGPVFGGEVSALQIIGDTLYVGGGFQNGADFDEADYVLACDLTTGAASPTVPFDGAFSGPVYAMTADSGGILYAGGGFTNLVGDLAADYVAAYNGTWHALGTGPGNHAVTTFVRSLTADGTDVYIGTDANDVAGIVQADHVARWNGSSWSAVGSNAIGTNGWFPTTSYITALTTVGSLVVAAGSFQNADGSPAADNIGYYDGTFWRPIGSDGAGDGPLNAQVTALGVHGGEIYAGGSFTAAGGDALGKYLSSFALRLPDAGVGGSSSGPFIGAREYSTTGAGQVRHVTVTRGQSSTSYIRVYNRGLLNAVFKLKGSGNASGITAHYYWGSTNITPEVIAGTFALPSLSPGGTVTVRVVITVAHSSVSSATITTVARSTSTVPPDGVRVAVSATG